MTPLAIQLLKCRVYNTINTKFSFYWFQRMVFAVLIFFVTRFWAGISFVSVLHYTLSLSAAWVQSYHAINRKFSFSWFTRMVKSATECSIDQFLKSKEFNTLSRLFLQTWPGAMPQNLCPASSPSSGTNDFKMEEHCQCFVLLSFFKAQCGASLTAEWTGCTGRLLISDWDVGGVKGLKLVFYSFFFFVLFF